MTEQHKHIRGSPHRDNTNGKIILYQCKKCGEPIIVDKEWKIVWKGHAL